jgi:hypothetical protein
MNTLSINLENLIVKFPQEQDTIQRLAGFINDNHNKPEKVFTLQRLYDLASPSTAFVFAQLLNDLVEVGVIKKIVRVESPILGGIEDFSSITEVPDTITDWHQDDITIEVKPENIRVLYKVMDI